MRGCFPVTYPGFAKLIKSACPCGIICNAVVIFVNNTVYSCKEFKITSLIIKLLIIYLNQGYYNLSITFIVQVTNTKANQ
jgi:hypothetical protein